MSDTRVYRIGNIEIDTSRGCVRREGEEMHLRRKSFQVLIYLLEHRDRLVTKDELFDNLWQDTAVTDDALAKCVMDIRKTLGDDTRQQRLLKTIPKAGYRFIVPVEVLSVNGSDHLPLNGGTITTEEERPIAAAPIEQPIPPRIVAEGPIETPPLIVSMPAPKSTRLPAARVILIAGVALAVVFSAYIIYKFRSSSRPQAEIALPQIPGKRALVVMHFENQSGDKDIDWLREGLADMLITNLSRSGNLAVMSRQQLHQLLETVGHSPESKIRFDETLDVAQKSRAEILILGHFARLDQNVRIDVQLHDARTGNLLTTERLVVDKPGDILTQMDFLSLRLATYLGAVPDQNGRQTLTSAMTNNLDAYRYYSLALEQAQMYQFPEAAKFLEKAIALDNRFAMAYARMGYLYAVRWQQFDKAKPYLEKAFELSDRLSEKDRLFINAWYAYANRDAEGAITSYRQIISQYPTESEAYQRLGWLLFRTQEKPEEAIEVIKKGLTIDPQAKDLYNLQGGVHVRLGNYREAVESFQHYIALAPNDPNALDSLGTCYQWFGHYDEAIASFQRALAINPESLVAITHLGNVYFQQGRYTAATLQYQRYIEVAWNDPTKGRGYASIAWVQMSMGDLEKAEKNVNQAIKYDPKNAWPSFVLAIARDDAASAEKFLQQFYEIFPRIEATMIGQLRTHYFAEGNLALKNGRADDGIELLKRAVSHSALEWNINPMEDCLANASLELGKLDEAIAEYERILKINPQYQLVHYHLGQAYERKGLAEKARDEYQQFLRVWKDADSDIPEVITAKQKIGVAG